MLLFKKRISPKPELYLPKIIEIPQNLLLYDSPWRGLESILKDIITRFDISNN
jgi:hypothetical protein